MSTLTVKNLRGMSPDNLITVQSGHKLYAPGNVVQFKYAYYTTLTATTNSSSYTDLQSLSITPTYASSIIRIELNYAMSGAGTVNIKKNGSVIYSPSDYYMTWVNTSYPAYNTGSPRNVLNIFKIDSPNTTSSITYTSSMISYSGTNGYAINELTSGQNFSIMTLTEIAQ